MVGYVAVDVTIDGGGFVATVSDGTTITSQGDALDIADFEFV